jgi:hypothetical protein
MATQLPQCVPPDTIVLPVVPLIARTCAWRDSTVLLQAHLLQHAQQDTIVPPTIPCILRNALQAFTALSEVLQLVYRVP